MSQCLLQCKQMRVRGMGGNCRVKGCLYSSADAGIEAGGKKSRCWNSVTSSLLLESKWC